MTASVQAGSQSRGAKRDDVQKLWNKWRAFWAKTKDSKCQTCCSNNEKPKCFERSAGGHLRLPWADNQGTPCHLRIIRQDSAKDVMATHRRTQSEMLCFCKPRTSRNDKLIEDMLCCSQSYGVSRILEHVLNAKTASGKAAQHSTTVCRYHFVDGQTS